VKSISFGLLIAFCIAEVADRSTLFSCTW